MSALPEPVALIAWDPVSFSDPFGLCAVPSALANVAIGVGIAAVTGTPYGLGAAVLDVASGCVGVGLLSKVDKLNDLRQAGAAAGGVRALLGQPKMVKHHIFNKFRGSSAATDKYRDFFKNHGIDVDDFAVEVTEGAHQRFIHGRGRNWTDAWKKWIDENPNATTKEVYQQAGRMMDDYGLSGSRIVRYD